MGLTIRVRIFDAREVRQMDPLEACVRVVIGDVVRETAICDSSLTWNQEFVWTVRDMAEAIHFDIVNKGVEDPVTFGSATLLLRDICGRDVCDVGLPPGGGVLRVRVGFGKVDDEVILAGGRPTDSESGRPHTGQSVRTPSLHALALRCGDSPYLKPVPNPARWGRDHAKRGQLFRGAKGRRGKEGGMVKGPSRRRYAEPVEGDYCARSAWWLEQDTTVRDRRERRAFTALSRSPYLEDGVEMRERGLAVGHRHLEELARRERALCRKYAMDGEAARAYAEAHEVRRSDLLIHHRFPVLRIVPTVTRTAADV